ncbi:MAG: stage II sporulation protein R [Lachnospiraceae bacterium]|nr:stage II sporulation protein R [Lachnospiraceae bacterium]
MVFRIIRGALLGIVLGLLMGIGLSGSMYMFNYMKSGGDWEQESLVAKEDRRTLAIDTEAYPNGGYVPAISPSAIADKDYDAGELKAVLKEEGISSLAKNIAEDNWYQGDEVVAANSYDTKALDDADLENDVLGNNLIRFHVRANSNSDVDIALKYTVRDKVLAEIEEGLKACETKDEAKEYLTENLELIKVVAEEALSAEGYNYSVKAYLTNDYFPIRQYGDMVLPAGYYEALRIDIGLANGENFWCLLYPTMCVPVEAGGVVTQDGQQEIKESLTSEQYDKLFVKKEIPEEKIEIRFKLLELIFGEE